MEFKADAKVGTEEGLKQTQLPPRSGTTAHNDDYDDDDDGGVEAAMKDNGAILASQQRVVVLVNHNVRSGALEFLQTLENPVHVSGELRETPAQPEHRTFQVDLSNLPNPREGRLAVSFVLMKNISAGMTEDAWQEELVAECVLNGLNSVSDVVLVVTDTEAQDHVKRFQQQQQNRNFEEQRKINSNNNSDSDKVESSEEKIETDDKTEDKTDAKKNKKKKKKQNKAPLLRSLSLLRRSFPSHHERMSLIVTSTQHRSDESVAQTVKDLRSALGVPVLAAAHFSQDKVLDIYKAEKDRVIDRRHAIFDWLTNPDILTDIRLSTMSAMQQHSARTKLELDEVEALLSQPGTKRLMTSRMDKMRKERMRWILVSKEDTERFNTLVVRISKRNK